jgi:heme A synthase
MRCEWIGAPMSDWQVRLNQMGTGVFIAVTLFGAITFSDASKAIVVAVDLGLAAIGVFAFLLGYWTAVQRSRTDEISVTELYFMVNNVAPANIRRLMVWCLTSQVVVGVAGAITRPNTDGKPGSVLAFGVLVPLFGLGLNGHWTANNGTFGPRRRKSPADDDGVGQD